MGVGEYMHVCVPVSLFIFVPTHNAYMCLCVLVYKHVSVVWMAFTQCCGYSFFTFTYSFMSPHTLLILYYEWKVQVCAWLLLVY